MAISHVAACVSEPIKVPHQEDVKWREKCSKAMEPQTAPWAWQTLFPGEVVEPPSMEIFKSLWERFWPTSSRCPWVSRAVGPDDPCRSFPTSTAPCFCDSVQGTRHLKPQFSESPKSDGAVSVPSPWVCLIFISSWLFSLLQTWWQKVHKKMSGVIQRHRMLLRTKWKSGSISKVFGKIIRVCCLDHFTP